MYKHLFGPVSSRRLGISLGVDLVTHKICSLNCIYCECGKTTNLTLDRKEYVSYDDVISEFDHYFKNNPDPDYITFSGSGEPTLNSKIKNVIKYIKDNKPGLSIAVLTNGTLLNKKEVREALSLADLVMPSFDAALPSSFKKINRPFPSINIDSFIKGLVDFRHEYKGKIALEILIIPGFNDSKEELRLIKKSCEKIKPDVIQLNTLDRPGAVSDIVAASKTQLESIKSFFEEGDHSLKVEIIASVPKQKSIKHFRKDIDATIMETIYRRPCTAEDIALVLGIKLSQVNNHLTALEADGKITSVRQDRGTFYQRLDKDLSCQS